MRLTQPLVKSVPAVKHRGAVLTTDAHLAPSLSLDRRRPIPLLPSVPSRRVTSSTQYFTFANYSYIVEVRVDPALSGSGPSQDFYLRGTNRITGSTRTNIHDPSGIRTVLTTSVLLFTPVSLGLYISQHDPTETIYTDSL